MSNESSPKAKWSMTQLVLGMAASLVICVLSFTHFYQAGFVDYR